MRRLCVVLTATLRPPHTVPNLAIRSENVRDEQYRWAINWWGKAAAKRSTPVFVFENSDSATQLSQFEAVESGLVSTVVIDGPSPADITRGKGVGEVELLGASSELLSEYTYIVKCTGRLRVSNWFDVVQSSLRLNSSPAYVRWSEDKRRIDTRFFVSTPSFLSEWMSKGHGLVDEKAGRDLETVSAQLLQAKKAAITQ